MEHLVALVVITLLLVVIPGPNVALIVANSLRHGPRHGLATVAGTTVGVGLQLALVVFGLGALLSLAADLLIWLKWLGVAYLTVLGIQALRQRDDEALSGIRADRRAAGQAFRNGLLIALVNPKTLVFNAAFLPQFVPAGADAVGTLPLVAVLFLTVLALGDSLWVLFAGALRPLLGRLGRLRHRLTGGLFLAAAAGLAFARAER